MNRLLPNRSEINFIFWLNETTEEISRAETAQVDFFCPKADLFDAETRYCVTAVSPVLSNLAATGFHY